jgi:hypothetical protein
VLIQIHFHARGRDGIEVDLRMPNQVVMRDEKLYRFRAYESWEQALADLGIEDPRGAAGLQP